MTEGALAAVRAEICGPASTELALKGAFHEAMAGYGINHPTYEGAFCATPRAPGPGAPPTAPPPLRTVSDRPGAGGRRACYGIGRGALRRLRGR